MRKQDLPKSNAQTPDGLHLIAGCLVRTNPVTEWDLTSVLVEGIFHRVVQLVAKLRCGFGNAGGSNDLAIEIGQRFANHNSNYDESEEHQGIHGGVDHVGEYVVNVQDQSDDAVEDGDARLVIQLVRVQESLRWLDLRR